MRLPILLVMLSTASAFASAADIDLSKRTGCNADNCLRALRGKLSAASSFCATYTTMTSTATEGIPTYVPTTCGSSRISSACTCLATLTSAPAACSTGQLIVNPSFNGLPPDYAADIAPWTIVHNSGAAGCTYDPYSYNDAAHDQYYGDERSIRCAFPTSGGQDTISQTVTKLCPGVQYILTAHVGCLYPSASTISATTFEVVFDGITITNQQLACTPCDPTTQECDIPNYRAVIAMVTGPALGTAALQFVVKQGPISNQSLAMMLDLVYLEGQGYTGAPYNPTA